MSDEDLASRYDSFQKVAVEAITKDFAHKKNGRFLLVIPTGGGKTYTAVKSICALFDEGILDSQSDKVLWTAHRTELAAQATETFGKFINRGNTKLNFEKNIKVEMISRVQSMLSKDESIKLVVIDEAHHSAAKSYQPIFNVKQVGVLGLTATPSRHDGAALDFEKESFSIGFPDLLKKGIILRPEIETIKGDSYDIVDIGSDSDLEQLNNEVRNSKIEDVIRKNYEKYKKIIIFVGTKKHAEDLCAILKNSDFAAQYQSISYILGGGKNSRNQSRDEYIEEEKNYKRSIIINVQVLTEGYDDPSVNTVVMATPSKSKLYYMQAIGRAVRCDPEDTMKKSFVVEIDEDLPNIRYRIDNRWLFSEISDALEPIVDDRTFTSGEDLKRHLLEIYEELKVPVKQHVFPEYDENQRYSLLLFRQYAKPGEYIHLPLLVDNLSRMAVSNMYNFISERLAFAGYRNRGIYFEAVFNMVRDSVNTLKLKDTEKKSIYEAMENASAIINDGDGVAGWKLQGSPWITYVSFSLKRLEETLSDEILLFIKDLVNRDTIIENLLSSNYEPGSVLIKLPLPLKNFVGRILVDTEFDQIDSILGALKKVKDTHDGDHRAEVSEKIESSILPLQIRDATSLTVIVRDNLDYFIKL